MKTAVEWLVEQLNKPGFSQVVTDDEIKQAKEMEKEQIKDAWNSAYGGDDNLDGNEYYNETFKTK